MTKKQAFPLVLGGTFICISTLSLVYIHFYTENPSIYWVLSWAFGAFLALGLMIFILNLNWRRITSHSVLFIDPDGNGTMTDVWLNPKTKMYEIWDSGIGDYRPLTDKEKDLFLESSKRKGTTIIDLSTP